ncbi:MAG: hypothetical protein WAR83_07750 [Flavobacteriales bacterium]
MLQQYRILVLSIVLGTLQLGVTAQKECPIANGACPFFSQAPDFGKQEIGINAVSWINAEVGKKGPKGGDWSYGNGFLYKAHCNKGALRMGLDVFRSKYQVGNKLEGADVPVASDFYKSVNVTTVEARLGMERTLCSSRLQPFVGVDFSYRRIQKKGLYENYAGPLLVPTSAEINSVTKQFLASPLFGIRFRATDRFSISGEASYALGIGRTRDNVKAEQGKSEFVHFADPLRTLSVNYHF